MNAGFQTLQTKAGSLAGRALIGLVVAALGGCVEAPTVGVRPDVTAAGVEAVAQALDRWFDPLDRGSTTLTVREMVTPETSERSPANLRTGIEQRLSAVDDLRARRAVGENSRGYLEARGALTGGEEQMVSDENSDRRAVYRLIAARQKTNAELVGRQRAQKIAAIARKGVWLQGADGVWYQKP